MESMPVPLAEAAFKKGDFIQFPNDYNDPDGDGFIVQTVIHRNGSKSTFLLLERLALPSQKSPPRDLLIRGGEIVHQNGKPTHTGISSVNIFRSPVPRYAEGQRSQDVKRL